ncbi:MAG: hypothetical protein ACTSRG_09260 [Candidatus Helarchaeota archaeon]
MEKKHFYPLILFIIPTLIITAILFILEPPSITILIGFIILLVAACATYISGINTALKD